MLFWYILLAIAALFLVGGYFALITRLESPLAHIIAAVVGYAAFVGAGAWLLGALT